MDGRWSWRSRDYQGPGFGIPVHGVRKALVAGEGSGAEKVSQARLPQDGDVAAGGWGGTAQKNRARIAQEGRAGSCAYWAIPQNV